jgi:hypothetical protein
LERVTCRPASSPSYRNRHRPPVPPPPPEATVLWAWWCRLVGRTTDSPKQGNVNHGQTEKRIILVKKKKIAPSLPSKQSSFRKTIVSIKNNRRNI